jgi:hypothetical protein
METDWRTAGRRWGDLFTLPRLLGAEDGLTPPPLPRFVLRLVCLKCEAYYLTTDTDEQPCPRCQQRLSVVGQWDLMSEYAPRWWMDSLDPGEQP